jgi:hypothetical protein
MGAAIDPEDFYRWIRSFSDETRQPERGHSKRRINSSAKSTGTHNESTKPERTETGGFGLSILNSSTSDLASPTDTYSNATSPTLSVDEKHRILEEPSQCTLPRIVTSSPTIPLDFSFDSRIESIDSPRRVSNDKGRLPRMHIDAEPKSPQEIFRENVKKINAALADNKVSISPSNVDSVPDSSVANNKTTDSLNTTIPNRSHMDGHPSPTLGRLFSNQNPFATDKQAAHSLPKTPGVFGNAFADNQVLSGFDKQYNGPASTSHRKLSSDRSRAEASSRQTLRDASAKRHTDRKAQQDIHPALRDTSSRRSYTLIPPPQRPTTSGERDENITALPMLRPPTAPLPITPDRRQPKKFRPVPTPLKAFPVPPGTSSALVSPTQALAVAVGQEQNLRNSVCSLSTNGSKRSQSTIQLRARVKELEREKKLLEAALQAVLKTSGHLNGCPCQILNTAGDTLGEGMRRGSADSVATSVGALDMFKRTKITHMSLDARSI